ncbi:MAG: hypothetical protein QOK25_210 [Thermoleophilaceae bacterium]|nr:hypothetical protein [Thermoleophilaceae bacterium]
MSSPHEEETLSLAAAVFRAFGVTDGVFVFLKSGEDEIMFAVTPEIAAKLPEARVVRALTDVLKRKVFLSTAWNTWPELVQPLPFPHLD